MINEITGFAIGMILMGIVLVAAVVASISLAINSGGVSSKENVSQLMGDTVISAHLAVYNKAQTDLLTNSISSLMNMDEPEIFEYTRAHLPHRNAFKPEISPNINFTIFNIPTYGVSGSDYFIYTSGVTLDVCRYLNSRFIGYSLGASPPPFISFLNGSLGAPDMVCVVFAGQATVFSPLELY